MQIETQRRRNFAQAFSLKASGLVVLPTSHLPQVHNRCVQSAGGQHRDRFSIAGLQEIEAIGPVTMKRPAGERWGRNSARKPKLDRKRVDGLAFEP